MKIEIKATLENVVKNLDGSISYYFRQDKANATNPYKLLEDINKLQDRAKNGLKIEIAPFREQRSLDANAYLWILCDKIAKVINSTKEDVYKDFIRKKGVNTIIPIKSEAVEKYTKMWEQHGLGWFCESIGESKLKGYTNIITYFGSSVYDTKEMSLLIDEVVEEAKELNIETRTPEQIAEMKSLWRSNEK